ncbi:MAG TPA: hypothetical protein VNN73_22540 [Blastocatellia bacterium]|nr:hypothetical protein [Blastocatellia bacterium]
MLCPSCGRKIEPEARECGCGARFVGDPLAENQFKVRRYEPVLTAMFLSLLVACGALTVSRWVTVASFIVLWTAWRAVKLARRDRESYGGYRAAVATLVLAVAGSVFAVGYTIIRLPHYFEMRRVQQVAATQAAMCQIASVLENYKRVHGSYPRNEQEIKEAAGAALPADYWSKSIKYQSYTEALADGSIGLNGIAFTSFELRSAGPDGQEGTDDDIIMRNGVFYTSEQIKKRPVIYNSEDY